jgi:hypothetical protein
VAGVAVDEEEAATIAAQALGGGRFRTIVCDVSGATATEAELVVHAALAFFGLELAVGVKDVHDAGSLTSRAGGVGRTGQRLLLVLVL